MKAGRGRAALAIVVAVLGFFAIAGDTRGQPGSYSVVPASPQESYSPPPVPLPGLGVVPLPQADPVAEAMTAFEKAKETTGRAKVELEQVRRRRSSLRSTLKLQARALDRMRRVGYVTRGGLGAVLSAYGRRMRLERMLAEQLKAYERLGANEQTLAAELERAEAERKVAERTLEERKENARRLESLAYLPSLGVPSLGVAPLPIFGSPMMPTDEPRPVSGFAALQGRLPSPVESGSSSMRFARRDREEGVEVVAPPGTTVLAVADGTVAFAGRQGSFGELIVIEHEGGFFTVYANLGERFVQPGARVGRRLRIGRTSSVAGQVLFFAVRHGTRSLDARTWMGM